MRKLSLQGVSPWWFQDVIIEVHGHMRILLPALVPGCHYWSTWPHENSPTCTGSRMSLLKYMATWEFSYLHWFQDVIAIRRLISDQWPPRSFNPSTCIGSRKSLLKSLTSRDFFFPYWFQDVNITSMSDHVGVLPPALVPGCHCFKEADQWPPRSFPSTCVGSTMSLLKSLTTRDFSFYLYWFQGVIAEERDYQRLFCYLLLVPECHCWRLKSLTNRNFSCYLLLVPGCHCWKAWPPGTFSSTCIGSRMSSLKSLTTRDFFFYLYWFQNVIVEESSYQWPFLLPVLVPECHLWRAWPPGTFPSTFTGSRMSLLKNLLPGTFSSTCIGSRMSFLKRLAAKGFSFCLFWFQKMSLLKSLATFYLY